MKTKRSGFLGKAGRFASHRWREWPHRISARWYWRHGVTARKRRQELIISLTTIPERIGMVHLCLDSLLWQSVKPDRIILWLSEGHDPERHVIRRGNLPRSLTNLMRRGLEIHWCEDIGSYRKLIPTMKAHPGALIVTADDDIFYPRHWLGRLYEAYLKDPQYIHCHRAHGIKRNEAGELLPYRQWNYEAVGEQGPSLDLFPTSGAGVLYAPGHLHPEALNEKSFLELCPRGDDVWQKAMSLLNETLCKKVAPKSFHLYLLRIPNNRALGKFNYSEDGNDRQIQDVARHYGVFTSETSMRCRARYHGLEANAIEKGKCLGGGL